MELHKGLNVKPDTHKAVLEIMGDMQREADCVLHIDDVITRMLAVYRNATSKRGLSKG